MKIAFMGQAMVGCLLFMVNIAVILYSLIYAVLAFIVKLPGT